jgi:azurin
MLRELVMTTQKLFIVSIILFLFSIFILVSTPSVEAAVSQCEITVDATDAMSFSTKTIEVSKSCKEFTVNLKHTGKLPKSVMGHI